MGSSYLYEVNPLLLREKHSTVAIYHTTSPLLHLALATRNYFFASSLDLPELQFSTYQLYFY